MTRTDELTTLLLDGALTDAEAAELDALMAADPAARAAHLALLAVEAALRGSRTDFDPAFAAATVARIEGERAAGVAARVMAEIAARPAPGWGRRPARRLVRSAGLAALAFALLVCVWVVTRPANGPRPDDPALPIDRSEVARMTLLSGTVEVVESGEVLAAGAPLRPGLTIRTVGEDGAAVVGFADHTQVELYPETEVRLAAGGDGVDEPRRVHLVRGQVTAVVGGETVVSTDAADAAARSGTFSMFSAGPGSARVEAKDGDVRVSRGEPGETEPVAVGPGRAAFVRDDATPIAVEPPLRPHTVPRDALDLRAAAYSVAFTPDGREVWTTSAKQFVRWAVGPGAAEPRVARDLYLSAAGNDGFFGVLSADRGTLVSCSTDLRHQKSVLVRTLPAGTVRATLPVLVAEPGRVCVAPDGGWVATADPRPQPRLRVWDTATARERFAVDWDTVLALAATPDGRHLAADAPEQRRAPNRIAFFDAATGDRAFELVGTRRYTTAMAFTRDGRTLAAGSNGAVQVWDVAARKVVRTVVGFERTVTAAAFSDDGSLLAAGLSDGQVWVWSARTGRRVQVLETGTRGVRALAFSPDGKSLVTSTNKAPTAVWDVAPEPPAEPAGL